MNESLIGGLLPDREGPQGRQPIARCDYCNTPLPPGGAFCLECGPPQVPQEEPEETGTTREQALFRIGMLVVLFLAVAFVKLDVSFDRLFFGPSGETTGETLADGERPQDADFKIIHSVITPFANVRAEPTLKGRIITVVEEGMTLDILQDNGRWSKIRVFNKTGWISNKVLKSEVREPE